MLRRTSWVFIAAALLALPLARQAQAISICTSGTNNCLAYYLGGPDLVSGDKTIDFTGYTPAGDAIDPKDITVTAIYSGGNYGFQLTGAFLTTGSADFLLSYNVTADDPNLISDIHLGFNGAFTGTGATNVSETAYACADPLACDPIGQLSVSNPPPVFSGAVDLSSFVKTVYVVKDISYSGGTNGSAHISSISQTFSQTAVPEPASLLLLGSGLAGLGFVGRRKKQARSS